MIFCNFLKSNYIQFQCHFSCQNFIIMLVYYAFKELGKKIRFIFCCIFQKMTWLKIWSITKCRLLTLLITKTIDDDDWMAKFDVTTGNKEKSVSSLFIGYPTKEATLLSWRLQSPKKGLTYRKCFVRPRNNYNINPNFEVLKMFPAKFNLEICTVVWWVR